MGKKISIPILHYIKKEEEEEKKKQFQENYRPKSES